MGKALALRLSSVRLHAYIRPFSGARPWPFCSSRSGGPALKRSLGSALLSALFRCRTRPFRQCCFPPQPLLIHRPPSGRRHALPVAAEASLVTPHGPANPHQFVRQRYRRFVLTNTRGRFGRPALQRGHSLRRFSLTALGGQ